jgi:cytochrome c-type biogenesis protein
MIGEIFSLLSDSLTQSLWIALFGAFVWGVLSILLSPCHLSSIPLVIGFVMQQEKKTTSRAFFFSLILSLGILFSIALIGIITSSLGRLMGDLGRTGNLFVVAIFFIVGLYLLDVIKLNWSPGLKPGGRGGLLSALMLGLIFGIALGPCTFAFVAPVLGIAFTRAQTSFISAFALILIFGLGHCSVIVFFGTLAQKAQSYLDRTHKSKAIVWAKKASGILVIAAGIYLLIITF